MRRKGFTLVELLATIVIIGILTVIIVPNIIEALKDSKEKMFLINTKGLYKATENYIVNEQFTNALDEVNGSYSNYCEGYEDIENYETNNNYYIEVSGGKIVKISIINDNYILEESSSDIKIDDINSENIRESNSTDDICGDIQYVCSAGSTDLMCKILSDNTVYADNVSSTYVTNAAGIIFSSKSTLTNGQGLYTNNKLEDGKNTYFRGGSYCGYTSYNSETTTGTRCIAAGGTWSNYQCSLNLDRTACQTQGFTYYDLKNNVTFAGHKWKIIRIDENNNIRMVMADDAVSTAAFNSTSNDNTYVGYMYSDTSLFQDSETAATTSINIGTSSAYYYGSTYAKNGSNQYYLTGDLTSGIWDTASICTSGSCPVANYYTCRNTMSSGTCTTLSKIASWSNSTNANAYTVTYSSQSYNASHTNINNSTIKTAVDNWYNSNLTSYANYFADDGYCSDRSLTSGLGYGANPSYYNTYTRNYPDTTASPRLNISTSCSNQERDLFTTTSSTIGNKALTNPIGLITTDEARYAGMVYYGTTSAQYNATNYLKFNTSYWTMSPMYFNSSSTVANVSSVYSHGYFSNSAVYASNGLRVSVSLKPSTTVVSGAGTYDDPYVIQ